MRLEHLSRVGQMMALAAIWIAAASAVNGAVTLDRHGRDVVLSNGIVTATIDVADAQISSIIYDHHQMVSNTGRHRDIYFSRDGGNDYERLPHCIGSVTSRSPEMIDFSCKHIYQPRSGDKHAWNVDVHFVVHAGVPGVYLYTINSHPAPYPDMSVGEWRMVWSTPEARSDWLNTIYIDQARHWVTPSQGDLEHAQPVPGTPKEVTLQTTGTWAGRYDCKYMYNASYTAIRCWGFASSDKHLGAFVVLPSVEFFNDGPNKQDLTSAVGTTLLHLNMNHYDGTSFRIAHGRDWKKFYGPWLLYFNDKPTADECWHDAQARVKAESGQWPYAWLKNADYPLADQRGTVRGQLILHDPLKPELDGDAWIGLSSPADRPGGDFQFSASGYQFWTRAQPDGRFTIANIRPGIYTLYAYTTGVVTQFEKADVIVRPGDTTSIRQLHWTVVHPGKKIAWEIGIPDRTAAEFAHGKDYYLPVLFRKLETQIPDPLDFTIGKSNPATGWYYAQCVHGDGNRMTASHWRIHFNLAQAPTGPATLTLAFAGADRARLLVEANDGPAITVVPPIQGGNGLVREAVHTKYCYSLVPIPAGELHAGENTITLSLSGSAASYVMYDYLNLELP